jgi:hypothetical protein
MSNQFTFYLLNDNDTAHLIHDVTHEQQLYVVNTLIETLKKIKKDGFYPLRFAWLAVRFGDLRNKESREYKTLDVPQKKQVYDYITTVLQIRLPPFDETRKDTNEHLWNFYKVHRSDIYRISPVDDRFEQYDLNVAWEEYETLLSDLDETLKSHENQLEEFFVERSIWISQHEVDEIEKAISTNFTYNVMTGRYKFDKILKYHSQRLEIKTNYQKWKTLVIQYGPAWLFAIARRCKKKRNETKLIHILTHYNELYKTWKTYTRDSHKLKELQDKHKDLYDYIVVHNIL